MASRTFRPPLFAARGIILATTLLTCLCARADTTFWTNFSGGNYNVPGNWFPSVPDPDDTAVFRTLPGNDYVVGVYDAYFLDRLIIGSNAVTFRDAGTSAFGRLFASNPNVGSVTPALLVGEQSNDVATLNVELFELNAATASIAAAAGSSGEVNVQGGGLHNLHITAAGSSMLDNLIIGERGVGLLNVRDGSHATVVGGARLGEFAGSEAAVAVEGPDSTWDLIPNFGMANLWIGVVGRGHLRIVDGSTVTNTSAFLGSTDGTSDGYGDVLVGGGADSFWINSQDLFIGYAGEGHLTVDTGGHVSSVNGDLGEFAGSNGEATVLGANSQWNMSADLRVGVVGSGTLTIAVGGFIRNREARIGEASSSSGSVMVSGAGSSWISESRLIVAAGGTGMLKVSGGGQVTSGGDTVIGRDTGSTGSVTVEGSGSTWTISGGTAALYVGNFGTGMLSVNDGGVVSAAGGMRIGPLGKVNGNGTIIANVINDGKMAPGKSPGILHINGNYEQTASAVLELEIGGNTVGTQYDQLVLAGNATFQGDVILQMVNGFLPQAGNQFNLLNVSGTFANSADISFTGIAPGWQFSQAFDPFTHMLVVTSLNDAQPLIPGDFNYDGSVDAADYVAWRKGLGSTFTQNDYDTWRAHFGQSSGSGAALSSAESSNVSAPEPAGIVLILAGISGVTLIANLKACERTKL